MSEFVLSAPVPLVWMGHYNDISGDNHIEWEVGWAFFVDVNGYAAPEPQLRPGLTRLPIILNCPAWIRESTGQLVPTPFCIDTYSSVKHEFWDVTVDESTLIIGQQPMITVNPSIHLVGIWHGWCKQGVLTG
jgi:hypothetical protein